VTVWAQKRFWSEVTVTEEPVGFAVRLDQRPLRTPGRSLLVLPTRGLAELVAAEWRAQDGTIEPRQMPFTRMANTAIEKVAPMIGEVAELVADYGGCDLICYRADGPLELVERQRQWDPLVVWAEEALGARLVATSGVMPVVQDELALGRLRGLVQGFGPFRLAAFHDLVALSGSLVLGFAVVRDRLSVPDAWALSRIDEIWQAEQWGADDEATAAAVRRADDFAFAATFLSLAVEG
jgi:chaperone required for assembly of F1-ATPase